MGKTRLHVLNNLAIVNPEWRKTIVPREWQERCVTRWEDYHFPQSKSKRIELGEQVGRDGMQLYRAVFSGNSPLWLREIPTIKTLKQVWVQNFYEHGDGLHWRQTGNIPPAAKMIGSPFDTQARFNTKRQSKRVGYKVHLTEVCDPDSPHLITNVITTEATQQVARVVSQLHQSLAEKDLLPCEQMLTQVFRILFENLA